MAKGNMLLGYSRGSVGDVVFTRSKGQQIARARNRNPKNPKTPAQMAQRVKFASVVEFFRRGNQNLFQFAFENKKIKQSDYNAFVSANADKGIYLTPNYLKQAKLPICAPFVMSQGSLQRAFQNTENPSTGAMYTIVGNTAGTYNLEPAAGTGITFGMISEYLVSQGFSNGDIVTITTIRSNVDEIVDGEVSETIDGEPVAWIIRQFTIDVTSNQTWDVEGVNVMIALKDAEGDQDDIDNWAGVRFEATYTLPAIYAEEAQAKAVVTIVSHNYADGLKVTSSELYFNTIWNEVNQNYSSANAQAKALDAWNSSEEAILQGSLS